VAKGITRRPGDPVAAFFEDMLSLPLGRAHKAYYRWLLDQLKPVAIRPLTSEELNLVKKTYASIGYKPAVKACYMNSQRLAQASNGKIEYVEGFYAADEFPLPFAHAWNRLNGKDFDPTLLLVHKEQRPHCYRGKVFTLEEIADNQQATRIFCSVFASQYMRKLKRKSIEVKRSKLIISPQGSMYRRDEHYRTRR